MFAALFDLHDSFSESDNENNRDRVYTVYKINSA